MAIRFDAATDRVTYSASSPPSPATALTITAWAFISVDRDDFSTFARLHSGATTVLTWATSSDGTSGPNYFTGGGTVTNATGFAVGAWRKIAITCSGTTANSYIATPTGTTEVDSGTVSTSAPTGITLGGRSSTDGTEWLNGRLAMVRVWSSVHTQAQIEAEWASVAPVITANLWADWPLTSDLTDHSGNGRSLTAGSTATSTEDNPPYAFPPVVTGTGAALAPTVSTGAGVSAPAGLASGTGTAQTPAAAVSPAAGLATATADAGQASDNIAPTAAVSAGTGTANTPTPSIATTAGGPAATGAAQPPTSTVGPAAGAGSGTGAANAPSLTLSAGADVATGTGTANAPNVSTGSAAAGLAAGVGAAYDATVTATERQADQGSWYGLLSIMQDAAAERRAEESRPPVACPNDGEPLKSHDGVLWCPFDGWRYSGAAS